MNLRDRLPHLSDEQLERYERMLASSPVISRGNVSSAATQGNPDGWTKMASPVDFVCRHRGDESGTCKLRRCCGQPDAPPVPAWHCTLLNARCVESGIPAERGVETCFLCSEKTQ